ncbi:transcriptional regulator, AbrB family [Thermosinus carboxydivorans Nor1]|uniref:Transcriptional regulator, AbrB family n=3 Tax=Sporomusaceae TaxID=1843490 RepID=A1HMB3_9FIRM|nr:type II toxin-antitoxin system PrlF family antitoxin [Thermosinus carboxydivorans]EAX48957.1 transcriptional regulator, AbrB family [Thermosinus carboxydivorans Nor1]EAX48973.1 transcriptional regulator, AbrB family [Thermosinus carboxydivorans Nor1]SDF71057.1 looped-hinge helix DNA binding domain-containing protein, AbrB family [Sporolituus thermophilus DSM 23256]
MVPVEYDAWATVTEKGQVTIPKPVRDYLGVPNGGKVRFRVRYDGVVVVERPTTAAQVIGRLQKYANTEKIVNAYELRENMESDRRKELGY